MQRLQTLARGKVARATFVEKKYLAMLDSPVTSSGELLFTAPDRLERRTLKPRPESVVLEGNTMTMTRGQRQMRGTRDWEELSETLDGPQQNGLSVGHSTATRGTKAMSRRTGLPTVPIQGRLRAPA